MILYVWSLKNMSVLSRSLTLTPVDTLRMSWCTDCNINARPHCWLSTKPSNCTEIWVESFSYSAALRGVIQKVTTRGRRELSSSLKRAHSAVIAALCKHTEFTSVLLLQCHPCGLFITGHHVTNEKSLKILFPRNLRRAAAVRSREESTGLPGHCGWRRVYRQNCNWSKKLHSLINLYELAYMPHIWKILALNHGHIPFSPA